MRNIIRINYANSIKHMFWQYDLDIIFFNRYMFHIVWKPINDVLKNQPYYKFKFNNLRK